MCGIAGVLGKKEKYEIDESTVCKMTNAIEHRGPDDSGVFVGDSFGMGMRRLSIIDVQGGKQPIFNEDQTICIVFNGEIYNHNELRKQLAQKGHIFQTQTDTETILHLYEEEGVGCLDSLRGMFAFAIWNCTQRSLFIARDRLGVKPLFYAENESLLTFGSEMKSLLTLPGVDSEMNWNGFDSYFTYGYIPAPLTIYNGIQKLPPAHFLLYQNGVTKIERYWDLSFGDKFTDSAHEIEESFLALLSESVEMRLMSEVPLGAFLSGGVDSGLIVALMSQMSSEPTRTFTINFGGETGNFIDESGYAREIAEIYSCHHKKISVLPEIEKAISASIMAFDEPFADDSIIPTFHICHEAKKDVTVILTGLGGDENFAGYERYLGFWLSRFLDKVPPVLMNKLVSPLVMSLREEKNGHYRVNHLKRFVAGSGLTPSERYQSYIRILSPEQRKRLYTPDISQKVDFEYVEHLGRMHFERLEEGDLLDRALYQDLNMYLADDILALSDRMGMHHSLELRVPFVDHKLIEFCARIPSKFKIRGGEKKHMLKKIARTKLPKAVVSHRKQGFCSPMATWLRTDLRESMCQTLSAQKIKDDGLFQTKNIESLINDHLDRRQLNDRVLFSLLMFQKWYRGRLET